MQDAQKCRPARPQRVKAREAYPLGHVEGLNDARTMLAAFFSILLETATPRLLLDSRGIQAISTTVSYFVGRLLTSSSCSHYRH
jgi:hypothetical protein